MSILWNVRRLGQKLLSVSARTPASRINGRHFTLSRILEYDPLVYPNMPQSPLQQLVKADEEGGRAHLTTQSHEYRFLHERSGPGREQRRYQRNRMDQKTGPAAVYNVLDLCLLHRKQTPAGFYLF